MMPTFEQIIVSIVTITICITLLFMCYQVDRKLDLLEAQCETTLSR